MTGANAGEMPAEPAPPILPAPGVAAEIDAAPPQAAAADALVPAPDPADVDAEAPAETVPAALEAVAEVEAAPPLAEAPVERALPFDDVEHLGVLRRSVLDALVDADEPLSIARIIQELPPGTTRNSAETAVRREHAAGRIEKTAPGTYRLAPAKPPGAKPAAPPEPDKSEDEWVAAIELWVIDPESWSREALGPRPDEPGRRIPSAIVARGVDRSRKREARRKDREIAATARAAADATLLSQLIGSTGGNIVRGPGIEDVSPIRAALELVPLDRILSAIRSTDICGPLLEYSLVASSRRQYLGKEAPTDVVRNRASCVSVVVIGRRYPCGHCFEETVEELSPEVGDGANRRGGISWGCLTPPLLHRRRDMPCPTITCSN
jgi:hypothetical protein